MWSDVIELFRDYMGTGLIVIWYLISVLYLYIREERKPFRILFVYVPVVILLLYFNPLFAAVVYGVAGSEIYYRILWLLPVTPVIAYACVQIYGELKGVKKGLWILASAAVISISGSYIYDNPFFRKAENLYHIPSDVVAVCDMIEVPGREVMAVFPTELLQYVRQYSPVVCMPYGRDITVERWNHRGKLYDGWNKVDELYDAMEAEQVDLACLAPLAKEAGCHYIILPCDKQIVGVVGDYNWVWFGASESYVIFRDMDIPLEIPNQG